MELESAQQFLKGKTILVTGATGFLAKVFMEKLLRTQPGLKKLYLLLRASDSDAATQRLHHDITGKDLFTVLRDKMGADFDSFMSGKVEAIVGDVSLVNLGLNDENIGRKIKEEIDFIVSSAATTRFDERFDVAMKINTMGALHVLNFAKGCPNLQALLHVSTAYVCGEAYNEKVIKEEPLKMGQPTKGNSKLDIESEKEMMEKIMNELEADNVGGEALTSAMRDYGIERANLYGWPNTYVFTKAMGEMILSTDEDSVPLIIIRPSIITSTIKEPFPGWIEGFRTVDTLIGGYGKGTISNSPGDPETILGVIPVDMVTNVMVAAMVTHSFNKDNSENFIYHVLNIVNKVFFHIFDDWYSVSEKKVQLAIRMAELYKPYVFFKAAFDVTNTENLYMTTKTENVEFDPQSIDWADYMMNVHTFLASSSS